MQTLTNQNVRVSSEMNCIISIELVNKSKALLLNRQQYQDECKRKRRLRVP